MVNYPDDGRDWYIAIIDGLVTQITIFHLGRGKFGVRDDKLGRFNYRIIDASDIICLAEPEKSSLIIAALFSGYFSAR